MKALIIISAAGHAFLRPREDLRRVSPAQYITTFYWPLPRVNYLDLTYQFSALAPINFLLNNLREFDDLLRQHPSLDMCVDSHHLFPR